MMPCSASTALGHQLLGIKHIREQILTDQNYQHRMRASAWYEISECKSCPTGWEPPAWYQLHLCITALANFALCSRASRNCSASSREVPTPAQTRGRQMANGFGFSPGWMQLKQVKKKAWHKVPALRQCSKSLIVISVSSVRHTVSTVHCAQV